MFARNTVSPRLLVNIIPKTGENKKDERITRVLVLQIFQIWTVTSELWKDCRKWLIDESHRVFFTEFVQFL